MTTTPRRMRWLTVAALMALVVAPGPVVGVFDGLPWSTRGEAGVALVLLAVACVRPWRRALAERLAGVRSRFAAVPIVLLLVALVKVVVWAGDPAAGSFEACYRGALGVPGESQCAVSFENVWRTDSLTRLDADLDFAPETSASTAYPGSSWNLGVVNDLEFNVDPDVAGAVDLTRFPFRVTWTGDARISAPGEVAFVYTGQGTARLGDTRVDLPPVYDGVGRVKAQVPPGTMPLVIEFAFTSTVSQGEPEPGPYARFEVDGVAPAGPAVVATLVVVVTDLLVALAVVGTLAVGLLHARSRSLVPTLVGVGASLVVLAVHLTSSAGVLPESIRGQISPAAVVASGLMALTLTLRPELALPVGVPAALSVTAVDVMGRVGHLGEVLYRSRGDDWLTYQAFARTMLAEGPLRGAEDVFYYQPGFRYLLYLGRLGLGDGDALVAWVQVAGFALVALLLASTAARRGDRRVARWFSAAAVGALWAFAFTDWFMEKALDGLSEVPAWIGLLGLGVLLLRPVASRTGVWVAILAGGIALIRPNQLPAMAVLVPAYAWLLWRSGRPGREAVWRPVAVIVGLFAAVLLLPLAHNLAYGGAFTALPTGANTVEDLPLGRLADVASDAEVRSIIVDKAKGLLHVGGTGFPPGSSVLSPFALMQGLWLAAVGLVTWTSRGRTRLVALAGLAWPFAFAASHLSYDIWIYYPRHVVAFNMSMVVVGLVVLACRSTAEIRPDS